MKTTLKIMNVGITVLGIAFTIGFYIAVILIKLT